MFFSGLSCPSLADMSRDYGPNPVHPNVAKIKACQEESFEFLSQALSIDETESDLQGKAAAIPYYEKGILALTQGIDLYIPVNSSDASLVRAVKLKEKMRGNLATSEERLNYLKTSLHLNSLSLRADRIANAVTRPTHRPTQEEPRIGRRGGTGNQQNRSPLRKETRSPLRSSTSSRAPRNNRAAELRLKSTSGAAVNNSADKPRKRDRKGPSDRDELKQLCSTLKGVEEKLIDSVLDEVIPRSATGVTFNDVSGQEKAKNALHEMVVLPSLRPELFTGLRTPARGLLLFGPPGNGKTLLARALATEARSHLINISSSSLTSKWVGEGEKLVRALFTVARAIQPVIIFIDEIDSLLSERKSGEHEAMRRIKTEFLLQFEGMLSGREEKVIVLAATNRPQELDDAALRRFTKRVYIQMPDFSGRRTLLSSLMSRHSSPLSSTELDKVAKMTDGYSCSDLTNLAKDAAMAPLREIPTAQLVTIKPEDMRQIGLKDFVKSTDRVRKSLSPECLASFEKWNQGFGDIS